MAGRTDIPNKVIENLRRFNRKERFYLVGAALDKPNFTLGRFFRKRLKECLGLQVPEDAFVAMDYHLNWVYASLYLANKGAGLDKVVETRKAFPNPEEIIKGNQEDIDLLISYPGDDGCHLLFLEAKGDSGFNNDQFDSKADRLRKIFGEDGCKWAGVKPHFALISPKEPQRLKYDNWPEWMRCKGKPNWLKLPWPGGLVQVSRWDIEHDEASAKGEHWKVIKSRYFTQTEDKK